MAVATFINSNHSPPGLEKILIPPRVRGYFLHVLNPFLHVAVQMIYPRLISREQIKYTWNVSQYLLIRPDSLLFPALLLVLLFTF